MRRLLPLLVPMALLAACADSDAPPPKGPAPQLHAAFLPHGIADTIVVEAVERLPLRAAELVAPDGTTTPASDVGVAAAPSVATGQWVAGNPWLDALSGGPPAAVATANGNPQPALRGTEQLLATVSTADLPLPDPAAYRRDWAHYRIRLSFGTPPGEVENREIAAPEPPSPATAPSPPAS